MRENTIHDERRYDGILDLPHHPSEKHPRMSVTERAAQFPPFAALSGYGVVIAETGRLTEDRIELTDGQKEEINRRLYELLNSGDAAAITYFEPDSKKDGGQYVTVAGIIKQVDMLEGILILEDKSRIPIREILRIDDTETTE